MNSPFPSRLRKRIRTVLLSIGLLSAAIPSSLLAWTDAGSGRIAAIQFWEYHDGILIKTSHPMIDPDGCGRTDWYVLPDTYSHFEEAYTLLLTAHLQNRNLKLLIEGCLQGLPVIKHITSQQ